ncbi:S8 family serine peptidase [Mucilaginibacter pallidiroseus]|uniref:S8 family serine peptidase n=1 Tax=Mucilaginibacter pallidiroseus TaxID=2599295 RepID=A0A563U7R9_9SPHI|nr:S8 family serine peptidase [Mucilaginibacter pallidiroseus]TWR27385.1 S8 family serine peptidase [Mucilaginibacter pallidiroseus]
MGKLYRAILIFLLFTGLTDAAFAQKQLVSTAQKNQLDQLSLSADKAFSAGYQRALSLAPSRGWAVRREGPGGAVIQLQGVNNLGFPVFRTTFNNVLAAATTATNAVQPGGELGLNLSGSSTFLNNKLGIWDGGQVYSQHTEFAGKTITAKDNSSIIQHATHVAGTMVARGAFAPAKGMAFNAATLQAWDFDNDVTEMSGAAASLILSNHSYGDVAGWNYNSTQARWEWYGLPGDTEDYTFGFYDDRAQSFDNIAYNAPYYLIVEASGNSRSSTGPAVGETYYGYTSRTNPTIINKGPRPAGISNNDGYDIISTTGNAKNILTVGAISPLPNGPVNRSDVAIAFFSSWGPTDDGRIKPDIVGDGVNVTSTSNAGTNSYATLSGTSMATPNVTGSLYLLQEYYAQKNNGNFMRAATLKGLACHTAFDAGNVGPDYIYGWGVLNMRAAAKAITENNTLSMISENSLAQGQTRTLEVVASGDGPLAITISWTDPAAAPTAAGTLNSRTPKLVNDLDLRISDGTTTFTPWVLTPNSPSAAATTGDNIRDNIEQVYIANATPGKRYSVTISHKGTLSSGSQAYSVIATGVGGNSYCASAPASTADSKIVSFALSNVNYTAGAGCTGYVDNTSQTITLEQARAYPFGINLGTCGGNFNKAAKIFVDWNGNGTFETDELAATTNIINGTGAYTGTINVPLTVTPGNFSLLRIVLSETNDASSILACGTYAKGETQDYRVQFTLPANDAGVTAVVTPDALSSCAVATSVTLKLKNFGGAAISNVPVNVTVTSPGNAAVTFNEIYTGTINPQQEADFTLSGRFNTTAGTTYTITATTQLANDPITTNNQANGTLSISQPPTLSGLSAYQCGNSNSYLLNATGAGQVLWYTSATATLPVAFGSSVRVNTAAASSNFYAGLNDFSGNVGPATKNAFSAGGYNQFTPDVKVYTAVPVTIESARLYVGNAGRVTFSVTNSAGQVVSTSSINVTATRRNPAAGALDDDATDQGRVYTLNLQLPAAGNYTITPSYENGASLYRSNSGVTGYPFKIGNVFSITGNTATSPTNASDTTYYRNFYYFFYDMRVKSTGCPAISRQAVTVGNPVITQNGEVLNSSVGLGNQWLLDGVEIAGATGQSYTPLQSGNYQVAVNMGDGCVALSEVYRYAIIAKNPGQDTDIGLTMFPVPASTILNIVFVAKEAGPLKISLLTSAGQIVHEQSQNISAGNYSTVINVANKLPGTYFLKIVLGQKIYSKKVIIIK